MAATEKRALLSSTTENDQLNEIVHSVGLGPSTAFCAHSKPWLLRDPFVEARGKRVGKIDGLLIRACYLVNGVDGAGHAAVVAEGAQDLAGKIHLIDPAHAAHEHYLIRSTREAERPGRGRQVPNRFPTALRVENLDTAVGAVGDVNDVVIVDHNTVRSVERARLVPTPTPVRDEVAILIELGDA